MVKIKICGITNLDDALAAVEYGADALGFVFAASPRQVTPAAAARIIAELPAQITTVGVFVNSPLSEVAAASRECGLDIAQLHGQETPEYCLALQTKAIKSFLIQTSADLDRLNDYRVAGYLLDRPKTSDGHTLDKPFDWNLAHQAATYGPILLAGGLTPANVAQAIAIAQPYAVDVSSGVESSPGHKDRRALHTFIYNARNAATEPNAAIGLNEKNDLFAPCNHNRERPLYGQIG